MINTHKIIREHISMIRQFTDLILKGVIGISIFDLILVGLKEAPGINQLIGHWLQILFTLVGLFYFCISIPHKLKMQKLEREQKKLINDKLDKEIKNLHFNNKKKK